MKTFKEFTVPSRILNSEEVNNYGKKLNIKYYKPHCMLDELVGKAKSRESGIVNLDKSSGPGTHYVCYYRFGNNKIFYDSFGLTPPIEIQKYLGENVLYQTFRLQKLNEVNCGKHCLYMLKMLSDGYKFTDIVLSLLKEFGGELV